MLRGLRSFLHQRRAGVPGLTHLLADGVVAAAELVKDKKIDGITDLRDESDREGMRVVVELRRDANANIILNQLYKHTQLQDTFGVIMLALHENQPKVMNLIEILGVHWPLTLFVCPLISSPQPGNGLEFPTLDNHKLSQ